MTISSYSDLEGMRRIGRLVALALQEMRRAARPGITTAELDLVGEQFLRRQGARSAPQMTYDFPGFTCISVNDEIVHGVPGPRLLRGGDLLKLDVSAELDGYIADAAITVVLAPAAPTSEPLRRCAEAAFTRGMGAARAGEPVAGIGRAVEREVRRRGYSVIRELVGHGVGRHLHEEPSVPNFFSPLTVGSLVDGLVIAVEPMITSRPARIVESDDGWTLRTHNGALAAHFEHTVMITRGDPLLLTAV